MPDERLRQSAHRLDESLRSYRHPESMLAMTSPFLRRLHMAKLVLFAAVLLAIFPSVSPAEEPPSFSREEVIYGRKFGMALTMNVFRPKQNANGVGIVFVVSGGWF